tara:strand:- start:34 stop:360 length:327 start_codon:yes stop_codon:yes gene_type:complete
MFRFKDIDHIKRVNARAGRYFFSPESMRIFQTTIYDKVYGGRFFVIRDRVDDPYYATMPSEEDFRYKAMQALKDGSILTVGTFETKAEAIAEAKKAAEKFGHNGGAND